MIERRSLLPAVAPAITAMLLLGACGDRQADANPNAPGSPGTGNSTQVVTPSAADGPPGGPSGVKGSMAHPGASGADVLPGTSGSGTAEAGGRSQTAQPGMGLNGGLGTGAPAASASAPDTTSAGNAGSGTPAPAASQAR